MKKAYQAIQDKRDLLRASAKLFVLIGLGILLFTWIATGSGWGIKPDELNINAWSIKGNVGAFVGGIVGSLFSLSGFFLLYLTFQSQNQAFLRERFENKFFELIKLHRENVAEFEISNLITGRKCFVAMLHEFHYVYKLVSIGYSIESKEDKNYFNIPDEKRDEDMVDFAFKIFFFGVGFNSEKQLKHFVTEGHFRFYLEFVKQKLEFIQEQFQAFRKKNKNDYFEYNRPLATESDDFTFETYCYPFDGHSIRLGHYYRQLFQCVKFVDKQDEILSQGDKQFYISTLRAQLSNQEQLMLYYDSLSEFGKAWHKEGFFKTYSFLKNLPLALVKVKPHPHDKIGLYNNEGRFLFEWDKNRADKTAVISE
jgi:hypothetical protein